MTGPGAPDETAPTWRVEVVDGSVTRELRRSVLRPHVPPHEAIPGDDLPDAVHLAAFTAEGLLASTCFVFPDPCPFQPSGSGSAPAWHLRQMATDPAWRGRGAGAAVVEGVLGFLRARPADILWCFARETAGGFYRGLGFQVVGEVFTDNRHTIPHLRMWRDV